MVFLDGRKRLLPPVSYLGAAERIDCPADANSRQAFSLQLEVMPGPEHGLAGSRVSVRVVRTLSVINRLRTISERTTAIRIPSDGPHGQRVGRTGKLRIVIGERQSVFLAAGKVPYDAAKLR
jgi:hypothetical protein